MCNSCALQNGARLKVMEVETVDMMHQVFQHQPDQASVEHRRSQSYLHFSGDR